jgi:hypothetical protein
MVRFEKDKKGEPVFTLSITGSKEKYIDTVKALLFYLGQADDNTITNQWERHNLCSLISDMLPDEDQIINTEEYKILKEYQTSKK